MKKHVLIVTTIRWVSAAQLALAFRDLGWTVSAVCPTRHPMALTGAVSAIYRYRALRPLASIEAALTEAMPDLVAPMDDLAAAYLHRLGEGARLLNRTLQALLTGALGQNHPALESRAALAALAGELGVPMPHTEAPGEEADLLPLLADAQYPLVLKADGTSGGEGVRIARTPAEALGHYRTLRRPLGTASVLLRLLLDRNMNVLAPWLLRRRRTVTVQAFVPGRDANIAVACWQGKVLAMLCVEALHTRCARGPSAVVRVIESEPMREAACALVAGLGLSGLCGFDFVIEEGTGRPVLIEMNGRATPTCHLALGATSDRADGACCDLALGACSDLVAALCSAASGVAHGPRAAITANPVLALFPLAWQIDPASEFLEGAYRDVPAGQPALVRAVLARPRRPSRARLRLLRARFSLSPGRMRAPAPERPQ